METVFESTHYEMLTLNEILFEYSKTLRLPSSKTPLMSRQNGIVIPDFEIHYDLYTRLNSP